MRKATAVFISVCFILSAASGLAPAADEQAKLLWRIGKADDDTAEFALAPDGYSEYSSSGYFVVGRSDPGTDWPYTHPGPADMWAGGRGHTFNILFALEKAPGKGRCRLAVDFADTHAIRPPKMRFDLNGTSIERELPPGAGDASITGNPAKGKEHICNVEFPANSLKTGINELKISTLSLSWVLYDCISFEAPVGTQPAEMQQTLVQSAQVDPWLVRKNGKLRQCVIVELLHFGGPMDISVAVSGEKPIKTTVSSRTSRLEIPMPPVPTDTPAELTVKAGGATIAAQRIVRKPAHERRPADYVDPMIGTSSSRWMLYPGPSMPFGMVKLSPDNQRQTWKAGYDYGINNIAGFSHLHSWTMGGLLTLPTTGALQTTAGPENEPEKGYRSKFKHNNEDASPGYYAVTLDDYGVRAELTTTTRAGFQRYTFPKADRARILFDLETPTEYGYSVLEAKITKVSDTEIEGYSKQRSGRYAGWNEFTLHFVARVNKPFKSFGGWVGKQISRDVQEISGKGDVGAFLNYSTGEDDVILMQTGISLVSIDQARLNLDTEMKSFGWKFDAVCDFQTKTWNNLLSTIEIEGGTEADQTKFYTNMYRSYCARTILSDVNGKYVDMYEKVQQLDDPSSPVYGCDAFWNTFWNLNQLWALAHPELTNKWVLSLLEISDRGGWLPKGPAGIEYSSIMVASHEIPFIVGAWQKGIRGFDAEKAWKAIKFIQTTPGRSHEGGGHVGNRRLKPYMELGYVPVERGPVSNTLEFAYDDWCAAQMAKALGKDDDYDYFMKRAMNYKNVFDPSVGYMRKKHANGEWAKDFSPYNSRGFVEGNSWQFTWFVPQDVKGLIGLIGRDTFNSRLNEGFVKSRESKFNATNDRFSQYPINHGNQPNMQAAWLFNYSGKPWLTQRWTREILNTYYGLTPIDGWLGDEDQGQMGGWFVMSAMGLFQMRGGAAVKPVYEIGSPLFDKITIHLDDRYYPGGEFVIEAKNNSPDNIYVQSANLDGKPLNKVWFDHSQLIDGGRLVLNMGPKPNKAWGSSPDAAPPSATK